MRPLLADSIADSDVGLHRTIGVFLLDKVNTHHSLPFIRTSLVEPLKVYLFGVHLEAKEDES